MTSTSGNGVTGGRAGSTPGVAGVPAAPLAEPRGVLVGLPDDVVLDGGAALGAAGGTVPPEAVAAGWSCGKILFNMFEKMLMFSSVRQ